MREYKLLTGKWEEGIQQKLQEWDEGEVADKMEEEWVEMVKDVLTRKVGKKKVKTCFKSGADWDEEMHRLATEKRRLKVEISKTPEDGQANLKVKLKKVRNRLLGIVRKKKEKKRVKLMQELEELEVKDPRKYWKLMKKIAGLKSQKEGVPEEAIEDDKLVRGREIKRVWREAFSKLGQEGKWEGMDEKFNNETIAGIKSWRDQSFEHVNQHEILDSNITLEEVKLAIKRLQNHKAVGVDDIVAEVLKYGGEDFQFALYKVFYEMFRREQIPRVWARDRVFLIKIFY